MNKAHATIGIEFCAGSDYTDCIHEANRIAKLLSTWVKFSFNGGEIHVGAGEITEDLCKESFERFLKHERLVFIRGK
jgi:hypothetical protein